MLAANGTNIRLFPGMHSHVNIEVVLPRAPVTAFLARKWFFPGVTSRMLGEMVFSCKSIVAGGAGIGPLPGMGTYMLS